MKRLTATQAYKLAIKLGIDVSNDGKTYYASNNDESEVYCFDSKRERDEFVDKKREA